MNEAITIILPIPNRVLSPNCAVGSLRGRFMKAAAAKKYRKQAKDAAEACGVETGPWQMANVAATFYHSMKRRRDQDNAMAALKSAYDGIVDAGIVVDDDYEHLRRDAPDFLIDKKHPRVELIIRRIK